MGAGVVVGVGVGVVVGSGVVVSEEEANFIGIAILRVLVYRPIESSTYSIQ